MSAKKQRNSRKRIPKNLAMGNATTQNTNASIKTAKQSAPLPSHDWRGALVYIFSLWIISRGILTAVGLYARNIFEAPANLAGNIQQAFGITSGFSWLDIWSAWDSKYYYLITKLGYLGAAVAHGKPNDVWAFFPLYNWASKPFALLFGETYFGMLFVSNLALIAGAYAFYRLAEYEYGAGLARRAVLILFAFPTAYVFSCLMTESLFIALTISAWYFARRGNWWAAGLCGLGAALTRMTGLLIAPIFALEYLRQAGWQWHPRTWDLRVLRFRESKFNYLWIGLVPCGLLIYMMVAWIIIDNPLAMFDAQASWDFGRGRENPIMNLLFGFTEGARRGYFNIADSGFGLTYGAVLTSIVLAILFIGRRRIGNLLFLWSVVVIGISFSVNFYSALSMPRFLVVLFPVFLILAAIKNRIAFSAIATVLVILQIITFALWTSGFTVAV